MTSSVGKCTCPGWSTAIIIIIFATSRRKVYCIWSPACSVGYFHNYIWPCWSLTISFFFFFGPTFTYHYHFKLLSPSAFKPQLCLLICARWFISLAVTFSLHPGLDLDHYLNSHFCQLKKSDVFHIQETKAFYTSDSSKHITKSLGLSCDIWDDNKWKESVPLLYLPAPHHFLWQL